MNIFSKRALWALILLSFIFGCGLTATRPKLEMSLAASAVLAARNVKAQTLASSNYRKSEYYYNKAKSSYKRKYFNKAKQYAILARKFAEKAEFIAIRKTTLENLQ